MPQARGRRTLTRTLRLALAAAVAGPAAAQAPAPALPPAATATPAASRTVDPTTDAGLRELLASARLWSALDRPDTARRILQKVLSVQADQPQALLLLGELELKSNQPAIAQRLLQRLQQRWPDTTETTELQALSRLYTTDRARLNQLRLLRRGGNTDGALALARQLFPDGLPPGDLAGEFWPLVAGTPQGWEAMRRLFTRRLEQGGSPRDKLALAELLSQRDSTLAPSLSLFAELAAQRDLDPQRLAAPWRRALQRAPRGSALARNERQRYLAFFAQDEAARRQLQDALGDATTIATAPRSAAPRRGITGRGAGTATGNVAAPAPPSPPEADTVLAAVGTLDQAGRRSDADARLRQGLAARPDSDALRRALIERLITQGRADQALAQAEAWAAQGPLPYFDTGLLRQAADRLLAAPMPRTGRALGLLERGVALVGDDPWLRYDLARLYARLRLPTLSVEVMDDGLARQPGNADMRLAAALNSAALDRTDEALAHIAAVPEAQRSDSLRALDQRLRFERTIDQARDAATPQQAARLRGQAQALAGDDAQRIARLATVAAQAGDRQAAHRLLQPASDRAANPADRLTLADAWLDAEAPQAALALLDGLPAEAGRSGEAALLRARALSAMGRFDDARPWLQTARAQLPADAVEPRLTAVRLAAQAGDRAAVRIWLAELLARQGDNPSVRFEAARQAEREGEYTAAVGHLRRIAQQAGPAGSAATSRLALLDTDVPLLRPGEADRRLARATLPRAAVPTGNAATAEPPSAGSATTEPGLGTTTPFVNLPAIPGPDEEAGDTGDAARARRAIAAIEARRQPRIETAWLHSQRSATPGLSSLRADEVPLVAFWPRAYDGHWFAQADAVRLDAGAVDTTQGEGATFGRTASFPGAAPTAIGQRQQGLNFGGGWRGDNRRFDLGVIGAGFEVAHLVGAWREDRQWQGVDVSAEASRRPVTGSLLSYAGAQDPISRQRWGGVTNTGLTLRAGQYPGGAQWSRSASLRLGVIDGRNTQSNPMAQLRLATDRDWLRRPDLTLNAGLAFNAWHYRHNQAFYSFGHGGYYSPQRYLSLALPVQLQGRQGRWSFNLRASAAFSRTYEADAPYYPTDAALQNVSGLVHSGGGKGGGWSGSFRAEVEYRLDEHWSLGGLINADRSTSYAPTQAMLYLRRALVPQSGPVPVPPRAVVPYAQF